MTTLILRKIKSKTSDLNSSFEIILKLFLGFLTILAVLDLFFEPNFTFKAYFLFISSIIIISLLVINSFSKASTIYELAIKYYSSINEMLFIIDLLLLTLSILLASYFVDDVNLSRYDYLILINIFSIWFLSGLAFKNFFSDKNIYYWQYIWGYIKTHFTLFFSVLLLGIIFEIKIENFLYLISSVIIYNLCSLIIYTLRYFSQLPGKESEERFIYLMPEQIQNISNPENILYKDGKYVYESENLSDELDKKLRYSLADYDDLYEKIERVIDLRKFDIHSSLILRSADIFNISNNNDESLKFILNLHPLNDQRRINKYLIEINKKLRKGGVFIGCFQNIRDRYKYFLQTYPFFVGQIFYFFDFIWARVFPKLPILQGIYFAFSKGKNRAISFAGGLGRLVYCGFDFIDVFDHNLLTYVIAIKVKEPLSNITPSWGPIFAMRRVGKNGKEIKVLKFRTMHPYSEFLQSFVHKHNSLDISGKLKDDFRITSWGKIFRKYWIDELPMIINWLKGDLKLVGVRPLSQHYFNLYPKELQELRIKTKPGLVPPYYVDMPKSFDEIVQSEIRYLEKYFKNPIKTDITYFFKSFYNIIIKKARSK